MEELRIVTVMGKKLEPGGVASEELVDRCRTAARVVGEVEAALVIPTGGDPAHTGITEAEVMRGLMVEMGVQQEKIDVETEAQSTVQNAVYVLKMVEEKLEAEQKQAKIFIVTSAYHLPYTAWLFRQVAKVLRMDVKIESVAATGVGAYDSSMIRLVASIAKKMCDHQRMRHELQIVGVTLDDDFELENIDNVVQETLSLWK